MISLKPNKCLRLISAINKKNCVRYDFSKGLLSSNLPVPIQMPIVRSSNNVNILSNINSFNNSNIINRSYSTDTNSPRESDNDPMRKPGLEQLLIVEEKMKEHLPRFLKETHPLGYYTPDVIFENLYFEQPKITIGISAYVFELLKLRWKINIKFSNAVIQLLKVTHSEEDGTVKIRWRMRGVRGMKLFTPWKIKIWNLKESIKTEAEWHDGFSILYVRGDARIYKHTLQRVIANEDEKETDKKKVEKLVRKLNVGTTMYSYEKIDESSER